MWHKRENVVSYLPKSEQASRRRRLRHAYDRPTYTEAKTALTKLHWLATALLDIEPRLRRVKGHRHLPKLEADVQQAVGHADPATTKRYDRRGFNAEKAASFFANY